MMQKFLKAHPNIYNVVMEQNFVVKTSAGLPNAVAPLEYHRFLASVKAAVSSEDNFWQRQI